MKKYADVVVTERELTRLKNAQSRATGMAKYGRYKAWLHYANLKSWQEQGWHFSFVVYNSVENHCTCGLIVPLDANPEVTGFKKLDLDRAHRASGHRNLPSLEGECVAFIYGYEWKPKEGVYYYTAICQTCESFTELQPSEDSRAFVDDHNQKCMSVESVSFVESETEE